MRRFIGLMSGTSLDAVDAVALEIDEADAAAATDAATDAAAGAATAAAADRSVRVAAFASEPIGESLRLEFEFLQAGGADELARAARAANDLADRYAQAVQALLARVGWAAPSVVAIGAHGQTVRHRPELGYTIQLLNAARLAERCAIPVVADLRAADIAAGGQGAPLVPAFHAAVFRHPLERRAIVNLGGIANVTLLPPGDAANEENEANEAVTGYDTGPANTLLDAWCRRHTGLPFDRDGAWARGGTVDTLLLRTMLAEPYFAAAPPKSTGRDLFDLRWLERVLASSSERDPRDVQATLVELSATTVATACREFGARALFVCGGGARNTHLMERLRAHAAPISCATTAAIGIEPQAVEAAAFAWLAACRVDGRPGNLAAVTGARGARVLGSLCDPLWIRRTTTRSRR